MRGFSFFPLFYHLASGCVSSTCDDYALQYTGLVAGREEAGIENEPIVLQFLEILGDVSGLTVLVELAKFKHRRYTLIVDGSLRR